MNLDTILPHDDSLSHTHPSPQQHQHEHQPSHPFHRKIELQSLHDLTYLQRNLQRSAHDRLNLHFPRDAGVPKSKAARRVVRPATHIPLDGGVGSIAGKDSALAQQIETSQQGIVDNEGEEDLMRTQVAQLVSAFLNETWSHAAHSLSINGLDATDLPHFQNSQTQPQAQSAAHLQSQHTDHSSHQPSNHSASASIEIEGIDYTLSPFDPELSTRVASLHAELESLTASVAKLRRSAPLRAAQTYGENLENVMAHQQGWEEGRAVVMAREKGERGDAEAPLTLGFDQDERWNDDVRRTYEQGVAELSGLAGSSAAAADSRDGVRSLTSTVGKVRRAVGVVGEFVD